MSLSLKITLESPSFSSQWQKIGFFRTQLADFKQILQGVGEEFFSPLESHIQSSATISLSSVLLNLFW